jgi:predicted alpha/beta superfamily hydrolase
MMAQGRRLTMRAADRAPRAQIGGSTHFQLALWRKLSPALAARVKPDRQARASYR